MNDEENKEPPHHEAKEIVIGGDRNNPPKVSKITFDEMTGTITLKLASEKEIAESENKSQ